MSLRAKIVLIGALLCVALGAATVAGAETYHDYQTLQQQNALAKAGDVRTIQAWMTIPYIARVCHVPESYLYQSLHIQDTPPARHYTLHLLAARLHQPDSKLVQSVRAAILAYREQHTRSDLHPPHTSGRALTELSVALPP